MNSLEILVDDREQAVIPYFAEYKSDIPYRVTRVNIGDYSVLYRGHILFIIERKTWGDLASSIKDGRTNNMKKMISAREKTGCHLVYLIEGNPLPAKDARYGRIPYKNLRAHLDHAAYRDNIHITHSKNQKDTVVRIYELVKNYTTITPSPLLKIDAIEDEKTNILNDSDETIDNLDSNNANTTKTNVSGGEALLKEKIIVSDKDVIYKIWCCVPNITDRTASLLIDKYHISDLILDKIPTNTIYALRYPSGCIIGKRANKIIAGSTHTKPTNIKYFIKMLTNINNITAKTAKLILETISFKDLLEGNIDIKTLSEIKKTESRKLGKKAATSIHNYFVNT
jgi:ERCC4-type nuclease